MKSLSVLCALLAFVLAPGASVPAPSHHSQRPAARKARPRLATVCFDPRAPCPSSATFQPFDLGFRLPPNAVIYESEMFYAIILQSMKVADDDCERFITEEDRRRAQALFPARKVFTSRCAEPGTLYYTNVDPGTRFMAVYAGATRAQAAQMLAQVRATGAYPGANIRRMQAGFNGT